MCRKPHGSGKADFIDIAAKMSKFREENKLLVTKLRPANTNYELSAFKSRLI